jgi:hypothetical protein
MAKLSIEVPLTQTEALDYRQALDELIQKKERQLRDFVGRYYSGEADRFKKAGYSDDEAWRECVRIKEFEEDFVVETTKIQLDIVSLMSRLSSLIRQYFPADLEHMNNELLKKANNIIDFNCCKKLF